VGEEEQAGSAAAPINQQARSAQLGHLETFQVRTGGPGLYEITDQAASFVQQTGGLCGLLTVFVRHTSCSLVLGENADPDVPRDLVEFYNRLVPEGMDWLRHTAEGPDDMPAHIRAALTVNSVGIPVDEARLLLGTWQGIFLFEHRRAPHNRQVVLHFSP
jgi:secondary thiamine-phosphate synthase enzyme